MSRPLILLVDDFEDALQMYAEYLTFAGYRVVTAQSGQAAISAAFEEKPALIFMDLRMPLMTGAEALQQLRANPVLSSVPVVALTAHALEDERLAALLDGFDEVIPKPCLPDQLASAIDRLLVDGRAARA
jgi:two-component system, cell cycle response regulator DivK